MAFVRLKERRAEKKTRHRKGPQIREGRRIKQKLRERGGGWKDWRKKEKEAVELAISQQQRGLSEDSMN